MNTAPSPSPTTIMGGRFIIEGQIGAGGMGTVFRARDTRTGAVVAVKLLQPHCDPQDAERFAREAQVLAEIHHPHIVSYVAHGTGEQGQPYLVMEWLEGEDLEQHLRRESPTITECVALLYNASAALSTAHEHGVIHRDLKPSNLFLRGRRMENVVVMDFGLARRTLRGAALTRSGVLIGTPGYMAPEQVRGEQDVGVAADVFSLGCVLYECLTAQAPFVGEHLTAVLVKVLILDLPPVKELRPGVPARLSDLIMRMLQKDPARRFSGGLALHDAVRRLDLDPEELVERASATPSASNLRSPPEQLFFSVAVAVLGERAAPRTSDAAPERDEAPSSLHEALRDLGVSVERLADRSLVATVLSSASATDQALRAARCGLVMKQHLPGAAVAVATGRGQMHGRLPIGEAVDRALQLLHRLSMGAGAREDGAVARPSTGVLLDGLTENLLSGRLDIVEHDGLTELVGPQNPMAREGQRLLLGQPAPFVGREPEFGALESMLSVCIDDSAACAVGVVAPPGLGKSRLRHEFVCHATRKYPDLVVVLGRGDLMHPGASYGSMCQALHRLCGLVGGEPHVVQQQRMRERLGLHLTGTPEANARVLCFLGEQCGVPLSEGDRLLTAARRDPRVMLDQVERAFIEWLRCECVQAPVLLILEDLQWGDTLSVQLVVRSLRELAELPLFVLALGRPEVRELFPGFWSARHIQELPLRVLSRRAAERLTQQVLGRVVGTVDPKVVARIVEQGAGHPLFLEELIRSVIERRGDALPETVLAMLLVRLSLLDPRARRALRASSVFGETFTRASVAALLGPDTPPGDLEFSLAALIRAECIEPQREGRELGAERYKFRHGLLRDAAYALFTDDERVAAHCLARRYLEHRGGVDPGVLAGHALRGNEPERAAGFFVDAAKQALRRCDRELTQSYAQQALRCGVTGHQRGVVLTTQAWAFRARMDLENAYTHGLEAVDVLPPGSYWWAKAIDICFCSFFMFNRLEHVERLVAAFMTATPAADARVAFHEAGIAVSIFLTNAGRRADAAAAIARMLQFADDLDPHDLGCLLLADAYRVCKLEPDPGRAVACARRTLDLLAQEGGSFLQVLAYLNLGVSLTAIGAVAAGEQMLREGAAVAARIGDDSGVVFSNLALALVLVGQPDVARRQEARKISAEYIDKGWVGPAMQGVCHQISGQALLAEDDLAGAESELRKALAYFSSLPIDYLSVVPVLVDVLLKQGRVAEARRLAEDGLGTIDAQGGLGYCELPVRLAVVLAREACGEPEAAKQALSAGLSGLSGRAALIEDAALREAFQAIPAHRRLVALSEARTRG